MKRIQVKGEEALWDALPFASVDTPIYVTVKGPSVPPSYDAKRYVISPILLIGKGGIESEALGAGCLHCKGDMCFPTDPMFFTLDGFIDFFVARASEGEVFVERERRIDEKD